MEIELAIPEDATPADLAASDDAGERRSKGLRILSRRGRESGADDGAVLVEVQPPSDDEGVRVLDEASLLGTPPAPSVDEIFSRMRAERETAATTAEVVPAAA